MPTYETLLAKQKTSQKKMIEVSYLNELNSIHEITIDGSLFNPAVEGNKVKVKVNRSTFEEIIQYVQWLHDQGKASGYLRNIETEHDVWEVPVGQYDLIVKEIRNIACVTWEKKQFLQTMIDSKDKIEDVIDITWNTPIN